jgi:hypothetical protein
MVKTIRSRHADSPEHTPSATAPIGRRWTGPVCVKLLEIDLIHALVRKQRAA